MSQVDDISWLGIDARGSEAKVLINTRGQQRSAFLADEYGYVEEQMQGVDRLKQLRGATSKDGFPINVYGVVNQEEDLHHRNAPAVKEVGLTRTESLVPTTSKLGPELATLRSIYSRQLKQFPETTFRLPDVAGDKPLTYIQGSNRSIKSVLESCEEFSVQLTPGRDLSALQFKYPGKFDYFPDGQFVVKARITYDMLDDLKTTFGADTETLDEAMQKSSHNVQIYKTFIQAMLEAYCLNRKEGSPPVKIMLPMVTTTNEVNQVRDMIDAVRMELVRDGHYVSENEYLLGVMIETAESVMNLDSLLQVSQFISIGTSDLSHYALGIPRSDKANHGIPELKYNPFRIMLLDYIINKAKEYGIPVGVCGRLATQWGEHNTKNYIWAYLLMGMGSPYKKDKVELSEEEKKLFSISLNLGDMPNVKDFLARTAFGNYWNLRDDIMNLEPVQQLFRAILNSVPSDFSFDPRNKDFIELFVVAFGTMVSQDDVVSDPFSLLPPRVNELLQDAHEAIELLILQHMKAIHGSV